MSSTPLRFLSAAFSSLSASSTAAPVSTPNVAQIKSAPPQSPGAGLYNRDMVQRSQQVNDLFLNLLGKECYAIYLKTKRISAVTTPSDILKLMQDGSLLFHLVTGSHGHHGEDTINNLNLSKSLEEFQMMSPQKRTMTIHSNYHLFRKAWDHIGLTDSQFFGVNDMLQPSKFSATIIVNCLVTFGNQLKQIGLYHRLEKSLLEYDIPPQFLVRSNSGIDDSIAMRTRSAARLRMVRHQYGYNQDDDIVEDLFDSDKGFMDRFNERNGLNRMHSNVSLSSSVNYSDNYYSEEKEDDKNSKLRAEIGKILKPIMDGLKDEKNILVEHVKKIQVEQEEFMKVKLAELGRVAKHAETLKVRLNEAERKYQTEYVRRKDLLNQNHQLKGNVRVLCRVRPMIPSDADDRIDVITPDEETICTKTEKNNRPVDKTFIFDRVFGCNSTQAEVFDEVQPLVESVLDGYNGCIFAYGQTGSGKTFTMSGDGIAEHAGINYRAIELLCKMKELRKQGGRTEHYEIKVSNIEIYCEKVYDLLAENAARAKDNVGLQIKEGHDGTYIPECTETKVETTEEILAVMKRGSKNRAINETNMNKSSSRSHSVLVLTVICEDRVNKKFFKSKLVLVDLAGSERVNKSGVTGSAMKEAQAINKSLSCLGDVFHAIETKSKHIPFRNSKLTTMLKDALGHDNKALMIVQVSPTQYNLQETNCSLLFASRVKNCELGKARKHTHDTPAVEDRIDDDHKQELSKWKSKYDESHVTNNLLVARIKELEDELLKATSLQSSSENGSERISATTGPSAVKRLPLIPTLMTSEFVTPSRKSSNGSIAIASASASDGFDSETRFNTTFNSSLNFENFDTSNITLDQNNYTKSETDTETIFQEKERVLKVKIMTASQSVDGLSNGSGSGSKEKAKSPRQKQVLFTTTPKFLEIKAARERRRMRESTFMQPTMASRMHAATFVSTVNDKDNSNTSMTFASSSIPNMNLQSSSVGTGMGQHSKIVIGTPRRVDPGRKPTRRNRSISRSKAIAARTAFA